MLVTLALLAFSLAVFWGTRPLWVQPEAPLAETDPHPATSEGLPPAQTARGAAAWELQQAAVARHPLAAPEVRGLALRLTDALVRPRAIWRHPHADPAASLPTSDEAPFPRGPVTEALDDVLRADDRQSASAEARQQALLDAARASRLDPADPHLVDDPWRAVLTLEVERRRALQAREGEQPAVGRWLVNLAQGVVRAHPDAIASEHARLYMLEALSDPTWDTADTDRLAEAGLEALLHSRDALVRATALGHVERVTDRAEDLLPRLSGLWSDAEPDVWLAAAGSDHAVALGDPSVARAWLGRLEDGIGASCPPGDLSGSCRAWRRELAWSHAQLDGVEGLEPADAREALRAAAWRCQIWRWPLGEGELRLRASEEGWQVLSSSGEVDASLVSDCLVYEGSDAVASLGEVELILAGG